MWLNNLSILVYILDWSLEIKAYLRHALEFAISHSVMCRQLLCSFTAGGNQLNRFLLD